MQKSVLKPTLKDLAAYSAAGLISIDADCRIKAVNDAACHLLGQPVERLYNVRLCHVLHLPPLISNAHYACPFQQFLATGDHSLLPQWLTLTVNEETVSLLCTVNALPEEGAVVTLARSSQEEQRSEQRRQILGRLIHDMHTPISGVGLAAELLAPDGRNVPPGIIEALRMHHADLLRYTIELADYTLLELETRLPPPFPISIDDMLDVVLWRLWPYTQRRRQQLHIDSTCDPVVLTSQRHIEQALTVALFDLSTCALTDTTLMVTIDLCESMMRVTMRAPLNELLGDNIHILFDPYLRASQTATTRGLMSLAASRHALRFYGGDLVVTSEPTAGKDEAQSLAITLLLPHHPTPS